MKTLSINTLKTILSEIAVYKSERFIFETKAFLDMDVFVDKAAGAFILSEECKSQNADASKSADGSGQKINNGGLGRDSGQAGSHVCYYKLSIGSDNIFFCFDQSAAEKTIIFVGYSGADSFVRAGDMRFSALLKNDIIDAELTHIKCMTTEGDLKKLYRLTNSRSFFPRLNDEQKKIVTTEDKNMVVHGVAGSGKTNLCIDKIVFSAGRGYRGRVLYSTFSRGLLADTKGKITEFCTVVKKLAAELESGCAVYADGDRAYKLKAVENKLGVYLPVEQDRITESLKSIVTFLENQVDYCLIEDLYSDFLGNKSTPLSTSRPFDGGYARGNNDRTAIADEKYFIDTYLKQIKNHNLNSRLNQISHISREVIYKEIYGMILGFCDPSAPDSVLSAAEYTSRRKDSFSAAECETIYALSKDYSAHLILNNLTDNNIMSREMLESFRGEDSSASRAAALKTATGGLGAKYSLVILDEVQDMTEVNLVFFRGLGLKMFCVGDALQMINPSYFSFAYLKRLLYEKDISLVAELVSNYRSSKKIARLCQDLSMLNAKTFGVHSFVLSNKSVDDGTEAETVFINNDSFIGLLDKEAFNNYTIVTGTLAQKEALRAKLKKQEILSVAEIKGLERETVVLYNVVSSAAAQWNSFSRKNINRKAADENSVYRYYFNLLYVGVSRAKAKLYAVESAAPEMFKEFFEKNFQRLDAVGALKKLLLNADKLEAEQDEIIKRAKEFTALGQYGNARFWAEKIVSEPERRQEIVRIDTHAGYIKGGDYRGAGIKFLGHGMNDDALKQFELSGDGALVKLAKACLGMSGGDADEGGLDALMVYGEVAESEAARKVIVDLVKADFKRLTDSIERTGLDFKEINNGLRDQTAYRKL